MSSSSALSCDVPFKLLHSSGYHLHVGMLQYVTLGHSTSTNTKQEVLKASNSSWPPVKSHED